MTRVKGRLLALHPSVGMISITFTLSGPLVISRSRLELKRRNQLRLQVKYEERTNLDNPDRRPQSAG
ncbi:hypothetical protein FA13DRAFT_1735624 [Coprinellus micaceus]|uniref:Uncharacterized protein n=1 Tax=Coprinellus micaceus TaxID=71717 RepID=A0A4Y7T3D8_COPMI|nr:hypothetical protein FA13DRAFT_1735624 [Coprinellus micaceus]